MGKLKLNSMTITVFFVTLLLLAGGYNFMAQTSNSKTLKVAFPRSKKASEYDPIKIALDFEYIFLENIYSPLLEMSVRGTVESGVAESAEWVGDELKLKIRKNLKTGSGKQITPDDVVFSLKRLLVVTGNTHGNFKDFVCPNVTLTSVDSPCEGIRSDDDYVYLSAKGRKTLLAPMLTGIDFAVIPRSSVDPQTLAIIDYKETSGVYYVDSDDGKGNIIFKANPYHYHYSDKIAQTVQLVPVDSTKRGLSLEMLKNGQVDHITTVDTAKADDVIKFYSENPEFEFHMTMKIRNLILVFTDRGQKELSVIERRYIGEQIKKVYLGIYDGIQGMEQRSEFFLSAGEGGLNSEEHSKIQNLQKDVPNNFSRPIKLAILKRSAFEEWQKAIAKELPSAISVPESKIPTFSKYEKPEDEPHAFIMGIDTGFAEDISLISYAISAGVFGMTKQQRDDWMSDYVSTEDKALRSKKLRALHFKSLTDATLVPVMASPYTALARKPFKIELSDLFANNQLWRVIIQ